MNSASFLLCLVFAAIGYVIHPMIIDKLVESKMVSSSSLSDEYRMEKAKKAEANKPKPMDEKLGSVDEGTKLKPNVVDNSREMPTPVVPSIEEPKAEIKLNDQEFIAALQSSVEAGDVNEFNYDQVVDWRRLGDQAISGGTYDVGLVTYKAQTIFDEQELQAKALIKDGKVVRWLWATTNTKMR